jgi:HEAT repeat protein
MKPNGSLVLALVVSMAPLVARADDGPETREYSRKGEVSPGTAAPSLSTLVQTIENGSPEKLRATLEYAERVVCESCVPMLDGKLLSSDDARVREMAAWWLRRQPFAAPRVLGHMKSVLTADADPVRRARAAEALGELMDPHAAFALSDASRDDAAPAVRVAAVKALARLNSDTAGAVLADALGDADAEVRKAALSVVLRVGGFDDFASLVPLLGDDDADVRARAARLCGEHRLADAETALVAMLMGDPEPRARRAAAWALGRVGGGEGTTALTEAEASEEDSGVRDAIRVALRMR